jgi:hypothetical protein
VLFLEVKMLNQSIVTATEGCYITEGFAHGLPIICSTHMPATMSLVLVSDLHVELQPPGIKVTHRYGKQGFNALRRRQTSLFDRSRLQLMRIPVIFSLARRCM